MQSLSGKAARWLATRFLNADYQRIVGEIDSLNDQVLLYEANENPNLYQALLAAEDRNFERHIGVDLRGLARAAVAYWRFRHLQGASTIEQQLVRVIRLLIAAKN